MAAHVVIVAALYCTAINPAIDTVAGNFPKLLPLQIAVTISDVVCIAVLHVPSLTNILGVVGDVATVVGDIPRGRVGPFAPPPRRHRCAGGSPAARQRNACEGI